MPAADFIEVYDQALDADSCKALIERFEFGQDIVAWPEMGDDPVMLLVPGAARAHERQVIDHSSRDWQFDGYGQSIKRFALVTKNGE